MSLTWLLVVAWPIGSVVEAWVMDRFVFGAPVMSWSVASRKVLGRQLRATIAAELSSRQGREQPPRQAPTPRTRAA